MLVFFFFGSRLRLRHSSFYRSELLYSGNFYLNLKFKIF
ncbi:GSCOCG00007277001-RA-CDS [Cotesia congregata]|nr:GSCOCG00007277001-RA-CDS [Cotesia congregata]